MKFFKFLFNLIRGLGMVCFIFLISTLVTSLVYYNHQIDTTNQKKDIDVYQKELVDSISFYGDNQLNIEVKFIDKMDQYFVMMYSYYYFDLKQMPIQLFDYQDKLIVTINSEGILTLMKI